MVSAVVCPFCKVVTGDCFGDTGNKHKHDCPYQVRKC